MFRTYLGGLTLLAVATAAGGALGQTNSDRATARQLALEGHQALQERDFAKAEDLLARAYSLVPVPTVGVELARAEVALGKLVAANETYSRILHEELPAPAAAAQQRSLADARKELSALKPRLPSVVITVKGSDDAAVTVDGALVSRATFGVARFLDPGTHTAQATATGFTLAVVEFSLKEGEAKRVELQLLPAPSLTGAALASPKLEVPVPQPDVTPSTASGSQAIEAPSHDAGAGRMLVGDAAAGFGLGALGLGVTALVQAGRTPHGGSASPAQGDAHSRTQALAVTSLATGGVFAISGIVLRATASGQTSVSRELGWGLVGLGASGIGFGIATGLMGHHVQSHLDSVCRPACPQAEGANVSNQNTLGTWSVIGFVGGGIVAAVGIVLLVTAPDGTPPNNTTTTARVGRAPSVVLPYVDVASNAFGLSGAF